MNTSLVMGTHIDFDRGIQKYGSIEQMPQYPVMKRFAKEGQVTIFSIDHHNHTESLPKNCSHYQIPNKLLFMLFSWLIVGIVSRSQSKDVIYYFSASSIFALPFANRISGAKTILFYGCMLWSSGQDYSQYAKKSMSVKQVFYYMIEWFSLRYVDYVIKGSHEIDFILKNSLFAGKELPVAKGIKPMIPDNNQKKNMKRIIFVGWLEPIKNPLLLVDAFCHHVKDKEAELVFCGEGSLRGMCETIAYFDERVSFLGQRNDIREQLSKSAVFVNCSLYEAHSDAIIEAMMVGLPVIASDVGGNPDIIEHGLTGLIFENNDSQMLAEYINYFINSPHDIEKMGEIAREIATKRYDINKNLDMIIKILKKDNQERKVG